MPLSVRMTLFERMVAKEIAISRNKSKKRKQQMRRSKFSSVQIHHAGMLGEIAFANVTGLKPDFSFSKRGDSGVDFNTNVAQIQTIDVKTRILTPEQVSADLLAMTHEGLRADVYVLATVDSGVFTDREIDAVTLVGWCYRQELSANKTNLGRGDCFLMEHQNLHDIRRLIQMVKQ